MEYYLKNNIADVTLPRQITLAGNPAFVEFRSKVNTAGQTIECALIVHKYNIGDEMPKFKITEIKAKQSYCFEGTVNKAEVNSLLFYVDSDTEILAENIRNSLMKRSFFRNNFELTIPFDGKNKDEIRIEFRSKGCGVQFAFNFEFQSDSPILSFEGIPSHSTNSDTIAKDANNCMIELEIYTNTGIFLGENDLPSEQNRGNYLTSLTKNYSGKNLWFNLNTLLSQRISYSTVFLNTADWSDTGTVRDYRFIAKRKDGINSERFYCSGALFVINGYNYTLSNAEMHTFVFDVMNPNNIKPLTNRSLTTHIKGQKQYFNFILKDELHSVDIQMTEAKIGLLYKFYNQSGEYFGERVAHEKRQKSFSITNTVEIDLDTQITELEDLSKNTIGRVEVFLCCNGIEVSESITFKILPAYQCSINDFVFLNRLGGWDSFNFGGTSSVEFKTVADTSYNTLLPDFTVSSRIENVEQRFIDEQKTVKSSPVNRQTIEWLQELCASKVVFELKTKRYIIADKFSLKYNSKDDLFQVEMTYRYSDVMNGNRLID